jgi:hypothetical protein
MDVNDIAKRRLKDALSPIPLAQATKTKGTVPPAASGEASKSAVSASSLKTDVTVRLSKVPPPVSADIRKNLNEAIASINVATDATGSIARYLSSIDGFIEQAQSKQTSPERRKALESEANQLVLEIKRTAKEVSSVARAPIPDDEVRREIEEKLGKTLDALLPEERGDEGGLGPVSFSRKESIIETITNVARARERIEEMRRSMRETSETLKSAVLSYEIAQQNGESAQSTVRDVDAAARLASEMQASIFSDPGAALDAIGNVTAKSAELVK